MIREGLVDILVQGHARWLHVPLTQVQILLELVQHSAASSMDAEMLKCKLEVRDVRLVVHFEDLATHQAEEEEELLGEWQRQRA